MGVTEGKRLFGVVAGDKARRDLEWAARAKMEETLRDAQSDAVVTVDSVTLSPDTMAGEALSALQERRIFAACFLAEGDATLG